MTKQNRIGSYVGAYAYSPSISPPLLYSHAERSSIPFQYQTHALLSHELAENNSTERSVINTVVVPARESFCRRLTLCCLCSEIIGATRETSLPPSTRNLAANSSKSAKISDSL